MGEGAGCRILVLASSTTRPIVTVIVVAVTNVHQPDLSGVLVAAGSGERIGDVVAE